MHVLVLHFGDGFCTASTWASICSFLVKQSLQPMSTPMKYSPGLNTRLHSMDSFVMSSSSMPKLNIHTQHHKGCNVNHTFLLQLITHKEETNVDSFFVFYQWGESLFVCSVRCNNSLALQAHFCMFQAHVCCPFTAAWWHVFCSSSSVINVLCRPFAGDTAWQELSHSIPAMIASWPVQTLVSAAGTIAKLDRTGCSSFVLYGIVQKCICIMHRHIHQCTINTAIANNCKRKQQRLHKHCKTIAMKTCRYHAHAGAVHQSWQMRTWRRWAHCRRKHWWHGYGARGHVFRLWDWIWYKCHLAIRLLSTRYLLTFIAQGWPAQA